MNIKEIQELIKFVSKSGVNEVSIEQENFKITIKTGGGIQGVQTGFAPGQFNPPQFNPGQFIPGQYAPGQLSPGQLAAPQSNTPATVAQGSSPSTERPPVAPDSSRYLTIKSPMIGTFYRTPGPDKPPFVIEGDEVTVGKTVCVIEAMKLFNDIEAEISGRIVKVLVENASPVEYDQPLFLVEPL